MHIIIMITMNDISIHDYSILAAGYPASLSYFEICPLKLPLPGEGLKMYIFCRQFMKCPGLLKF